uniref:uncharacterized protein n=1 Tax=Pristiophorus japonicus TaxID=55135 RepID=UPI00398E8D20
MLRDFFVIGINHEVILRKLLTAETLDLSKAITIAQTMENITSKNNKNKKEKGLNDEEVSRTRARGGYGDLLKHIHFPLTEELAQQFPLLHLTLGRNSVHMTAQFIFYVNLFGKIIIEFRADLKILKPSPPLFTARSLSHSELGGVRLPWCQTGSRAADNGPFVARARGAARERATSRHAGGRMSGTNPKTHNMVAADRQWIKEVILEADAAKKWANRWGFLVTQRDEIEAEQKKLRDKCRLLTPDHLKVRPASPISKYIQVGPSPAIPQTTQGLIGWRAAVPELKLERYGGPKRGKWSFIRQMKWPEDCVD